MFGSHLAHAMSTSTVAWTALGALFLFNKEAWAGYCDETNTASFQWAATSRRVYIREGCATIADVLAYRSDKNGAKGPIYHFDWETNTISDEYTGVYYLESHLFVEDGGTLVISGTEDEEEPCNTLLIASNSTGVFNQIRAYGSNLKITDTRIFSWDRPNNNFDLNPYDNRSYISAITEKITGRVEDECNDVVVQEGESRGNAKEDKGVARMDILRSEIAYLGYNASESYGIAYKARGLCKDLSNLDIFDDDNGLDYAVYGDITDSLIHHNWFGHYSFGHNGGKWNYNYVHDNFGYGFDPHDDSDNLEMIGNVVFNNQWHGMIASKRCDNVIMKDNVVYNNGGHGIMLHRSCDYATVEDNVVYDNGEAGIALYESSYCTVQFNTCENNMYGIRLSNGASYNDVEYNTIRMGDDENHRYALYTYKGNDEPEVRDGRLRRNKLRRNTIYSEQEVVLKMSESDGNVINRNTFYGGEKVQFDDCDLNLVGKNTFDAEELRVAVTDSCFRPNSQFEPLC